MNNFGRKYFRAAFAMFGLLAALTPGLAHAGFGSALNFNGTSSYVSAAPINLSAGNTLTLEAWIKPNSLTGNAEIIRQQANNFWPDWLLSFQNNGTILAFGVSTASGYKELHVAISATNYADGQWHHVAATYDGATQVLYRDGVQIGFGSQSGNVSFTGSINGIAALLVPNPSEFFNGTIDDVRVWSVARSATAINAGKSAPLTGTESGLAAYYRFDEGTGTTTADSSSHGFTGTLVNNPTWVPSTVQPLPGAIVTTALASNFTTNSATLNGTANPQGNATSVYFDYGTTTNYGTQTPVQNIGAAAGQVNVTAQITGLSPGASYHYRIVGIAAGVTNHGADQTFVLAPSVFGSALNFNGTSSYVSTPPVNLSAVNTMTLEAWIKPNSFTGTSEIIRQQATFLAADWVLSFQNNGTTLAFGLNANNQYRELDLPVNPATFTDGNWHHIAATYDGSQKILYVDGVAIGSAMQVGNLTFTGSANGIGVSPSPTSPSEFFNGTIDEVRIWSVTRSASDIIANMFNTLTGTETGLTAYYKFDEGAGTATADSSSHGLTGTLVNNPIWVASTVLPASGPLAVTSPACNITNTSALLNGACFPRGNGTTTYFDFGATTNYGIQTPQQPLGAATGVASVSAPISGLSPGTTYHYRLAAIGGGATNFGNDRSFFTAQPIGGTAMSLNGTDAFVRIPVINPGPTNTFSLEAWIKPVNITATTTSVVLHQEYPGGGDPDWLLAFQNNGTILTFGLEAGFFYHELQIPIVPSDFTDGNWHHLAATYDGAAKRVYVDGKLIGSIGESGNLTFRGFGSGIGASPIAGDGSRFFNGQIDEVRIWTVARSAIEVNNNICTVLAGTESGLLAYYRFDEGSGTSAQDLSAHGFTGTLVNNAQWVASTVPSSLPPLAITGPASNIAASSATFNGTVYAHRTAVSVYFEYGVTAGYGAQTASQPLGINSGVASVSTPVSSLSVGSPYHYRLVAIGGGATNMGPDQVFQTIGPIGGTALSFNGTYSMASIPVINPGSINTFSLEAWIKPVNITSTANSDILRQEASQTAPDWLLGFQNNGTTLSFGLKTVIPSYSVSYAELHVPINPAYFTDGNWHHVAATYDGKIKRLFVDGLLAGSTAESGNLYFTGSSSAIGAAPIFNGGSEYFNGQIDEVRIWRTGRSATEINNNIFLTLSGTETGLLAYYRLDDGSGISAIDSGPTGLTGTLVNGPLWVASSVPATPIPLAITGFGSNVTTNSLTLNGTAYPRGTPTTAFFEYGATTNYGTQTPVQDLGINYGVASVSAPLSGLPSGTSFHCRLDAVGSGGTNYGLDQIVFTLSPTHGTALSFNGSNSYVSIPLIKPATTNAFSLEAWVKPANITSTTYSDILRQDIPFHNPDWLLAFQNNGTLLTFGLSTSNGYQELHVPIVAASFTDGNWHHLAATYDGTTERLYVDGALIGSTAQSGNLAFTGTQSTIGAAFSTGNGAEFFNGQIDEVRIWNVTRSFTDIVNGLFLTPTGTEPGLLAYYKFDDAVGISASDSGPNGRTGFLVNNPVWLVSTIATPPSPLAFTGQPSNATTNSVTLNGTAYPQGSPTTVFFDYGTTTSYGIQTPVQNIGNSSGPVSVSALLSGLPPGSIYHYRLTAIGSSTNSGIDQVFFTPTPVWGAALNFFRTNSYVNLPVIIPGTTNTLSLEAWIKPANITATLTSTILRQEDGPVPYYTPDWVLAFQNHGTTLAFGLGTSNAYKELHVAISPAAYTDGNWHHLAAVYDGANQRLYVDGLLVGSIAQSGNLNFTGLASGIGAAPLSGGLDYFNGQIDEARIWRPARTATDIINNLFTPLTGAEPGLLAYYKFDDGAGIFATDSSTNGHTGNLVNGPAWIPSTVPTTPTPLAVTGSASNLTANSVTLTGTAYPRMSATTVFFNYGSTTNYGAQTSAQDIGNGTGPVSVLSPISGLTPDTGYHYRLAAIGGGVTNYGLDQVFFTLDPVHGTALSLNGTSSYVSIPVINLGAINTFSLEAWIKPANLTTSGSSDILRQQNPAFNPDWLLAFQDNGTTLSFGLNTTSGYQELRLLVNPIALTDGNWHHLAATWDGITKQLFLDGVLIGSAGQSGNLAFSGTVSAIGKSPISNSEFFNGQIDEVRIWNVVRSGSDIIGSLFTTLTGTEPGLLAYYQFDGGSGTSAADSSPNGRTGTLVNSPLWVSSSVPSTSPPLVFTSPASNMSSNSAILNGTVYPAGIPTMVHFDYGTTINYGAQTSVQDVGNATNLMAVSAPVSGLLPGNTYHFRLVATGGGMTNYGVDQPLSIVGPVAGTALSFNGVNSFVSIPVIYPGATNSLSLEAWVKPVNITATPYSDILRQQASGHNPDWLLAFQTNGTQIAFGLNTGSGYKEMHVLINPAALTDGNWHHLAATYDGTNKMLYVDGVLTGSAAQSGNLIFSGTASGIGAFPLSGGSNFFNGLIDEVCIWRVARSITNILDNLFTNLTGQEPGLAAYYRFDDGSGISATDSGANGRSGMLVNGPLWVASTVPGMLSPLASTGFTPNSTNNSFTLNGTAYPRGTPTTVYFDYGTTTNYGSQTPAQAIGSTPSVAAVSALLSGLTPGLTYHYRLNAAGGGTTNSGADQFFDVPGPIGGTAISLNGINSFVGIPILHPGPALTFEVWIKPVNITATMFSEIFRQETLGYYPDWLLSFQNNGTVIAFGLKTIGGYQELHVSINPSNFTDGSWHNLAATYDGTNKLLYVDGILVGSVPQTGSLAFTGTTSAIGASPVSNSEFFNGQIDEVRIWNVARSAAQINNNLFTSLTGTEPGLLAYYRFDDGSGTSAVDSSPNGFTAALLHNPIWVASTVPSTLTPFASTDFPSNITASTAILNGTAYPRGTPTTVHFDYGTTTNYGSQSPIQSIGSTPGILAVSAPLSGLIPATAYHYRLVATGGGNSNFGVDQLFFTTGSLGATPPIALLPDGNIQIRFDGIPGKTYRIQSSTDLSTWVDIGSVLVDSSGVLTFEDPNTASHSTRFYRTVTP